MRGGVGTDDRGDEGCFWGVGNEDWGCGWEGGGVACGFFLVFFLFALTPSTPPDPPAPPWRNGGWEG